MIPLEVKELLTEFNVGPLTVARRDQPTRNVYGGYEQATSTQVTLDPVAAHNLEGRDLEQVPEADRNTEIVQFYSLVRLHAADGEQAADVITYRDRDFRIIKSMDYDLQGEVWISWGALVEI
jgi:hypothetical protein